MRKKFTTTVAMIFVFILSIMPILAQEHGVIHWSYEGEEGPENWGILSTNWEACSLGNAQSPINITDATPIDLQNIVINYGETALNIFNNGHTIQVNIDEGSSIVYNEIEYKLLQFHFHHPSEHLIDGEPADMEIHFVHASASGNLAVIGVMLEASDATNDAYTSIFEHLPAEQSEPTAMEGMNLTLSDLLPETTTYYTYNGSLTTPPCSEIVRWLVMTEPVTLTAEQTEAFGAIFENNARPAEPLGNRDLFVDSE